MRHNDGVQTYHARELSTARPVQVHFLSDPLDSSALISSVDRLPEAERRHVLDRGQIQGVPYVVTDRLAGYVTFREWLAQHAPVRRPGPDKEFWKLFELPSSAAEKEDTKPFIFTKEAQPDPETNPTLRTSIYVVPSAAKLTLGLVFGMLAAVLFLVLVLAVFAFRAH